VAALTTQNVSAGGPVSTTAASAGGDTAEAGTRAGGWSSGVYLAASIGATATTITVGGVAYGPFSNQNPVVIPVHSIYRGARVPITYSQVTGVSVAVFSTEPAATGITVGT
jgi:hypothetical protein